MRFSRFGLGALVSCWVVVAAASATAATMETAARQAMIQDYDTGTVLLEKNADELMHPSSMSKLMTVYMAFSKLKEGTLSLDDGFAVSERAWRTGGSKMFVHVGDRVKVEELLHGIIVQSGNDACVVIAENLASSEAEFAEQMTQKAREIGLTRSVLKNSNGWPDPEHLMTARDLATLARRLIEDFPSYYPIFKELEYTYNKIKQGNRNPLLYKPDLGADGLKTGHTEEGGYGLTASAVRGGRRLIMVLNGLPSMKARASESERLLEWAFREFENYSLFGAGQEVSTAEVWLGDRDAVPLVSDKKVVYTLPRQGGKDIKATVVYDGPIPAPIRKGDRIATLKIAVPNMEPVELPLLAGADVGRLGFTGRLGALLKHTLWGGGR